ncbi:hypothetical protein [Burkholderia cenocepacia]|uniref:hypothetical protein n=1 Tax=Burkholderia cenocepacia TaxID=95486 RepID=UPI002AAFD477|nr:hypothetical protein [Burkholderia cenocepacia]
MTIGDARAWDLGKARIEASKLKTLVDEGKDPREVRADQRAAHEARRAEARRKDVTFGEAWDDYVETRKSFWGALHYRDHLQHGGVVANLERAAWAQKAGPLAPLRPVKLSDLTGSA